jgi:hypothetical protein
MRILRRPSPDRRQGRRESNARLPYVAGLILLGLLGLLAQGACVPHTHTGIGVGLYNAEHDLTLFAVGGTVAPLPAAMFLFVSLVMASLSLSVPVAPIPFVSRDADSRAPPTA